MLLEFAQVVKPISEVMQLRPPVSMIYNPAVLIKFYQQPVFVPIVEQIFEQMLIRQLVSMTSTVAPKHKF